MAVLEVLSRWKRADRAALDRALAAEPEMDAPARAALALALRQSGRDAEARLLVDRLAAAPGSGDAATVLLALLTADPAGPRGPLQEVAYHLLAGRAGAAWATPGQSAAALVALSRYAEAVTESAVPGPYRISVNGQAQEIAAGPGAGDGRATLTVPGSRLHTGDNTVRFEISGGRLYYSLRVQAQVASADTPPAGRKAEGSDLGLRRSRSLAEPATVALTITLPSALPGATLRDPLPAGLVALPGATLVRLPDAADSATVPPADWSESLLIAPADAAAPGPTFHLGPLPAGTYMLTYPVAPHAPGRYTALPARLDVAGPDGGWVQSGSDTVTVGP